MGWSYQFRKYGSSREYSLLSFDWTPKVIEIELEKSLLIFESESFFKYLSPFLSFIYYQFLQHLTWILGLKPSAGGTLKAMPASEAPNVVRIKSYVNCFVKIESFKVVPSVAREI